MPDYFNLFIGGATLFSTFGKEDSSMIITIMKAVGAVAAGRNRKFAGERLMYPDIAMKAPRVQIPPCH